MHQPSTSFNITTVHLLVGWQSSILNGNAVNAPSRKSAPFADSILCDWPASPMLDAFSQPVQQQTLAQGFQNGKKYQEEIGK